jgi:predicted HicB family RNase H-like nuclease
MERKGTAATKAKNKYNAANYDRLYPYVKKGRKAAYEEAAREAEVSLNDYIITAIEEKVARDQLKVCQRSTKRKE